MLLAGLLHSAILRRSCGGLGRQILTLEEPIEFDFGLIPHAQRSAPIAQSEIPGHVLDWAGGVRFSIPGWHGAVSASLHGYRKR